MANHNNNSRNYTPLPNIPKSSEKNKEMLNLNISNPAVSNPLLDLLNGSFPCNQDNINVTSKPPSNGPSFLKVEQVPTSNSYLSNEIKKNLNNSDANASGTIFTYIDPFSLISEEIFDSNALKSQPSKVLTTSNKKNNSMKHRNKGYRLPQKSIYFEKDTFSSANQFKKFPERHCVKTLTKNNSSIHKHIVSQKGFGIYSGIDGKITAFKETTNDRIQLKEHKQDIIDMTFWIPSNQDFDSEDRYLATVSLDSSLLLWRFNNVIDPKKPISYTLEFGLKGNPRKGSTYSYLLVEINPANMDIIAVVTDVNEVLLIDLCLYMKPSGTVFSNEAELGNIITTVKMNKKISALAFSLDGEQLAIGDINGNIRLITLSDNSITSSKTLSADSGLAINYLKFTGVDNNLLIVGIDGNFLIQLWDIPNQQLIQTINLPNDYESKNLICFENDSSILFVVANARNALMAFHLTNYFSFFSEYILADKQLDIDATQDIVTFKDSSLKRNISLYLKNHEFVKTYSIPICTFIPGETTEFLTLLESHFSAPDLLDNLLKSASDNNALKSYKGKNKQHGEPTFSEIGLMNDQKHNQLNNTDPNLHSFDFDNISVESLFGVKKSAHEKNNHISNPDYFKNKHYDSTTNQSTKSQILIPSSVISTSNPKKINSIGGKAQSPRISSKNEVRTCESNGVLSSSIIDLVKQEMSSNSQKVTEDITKLDSQLKDINRLAENLLSDLFHASNPDLTLALQEVLKNELPEIVHKQFKSSFDQFLESEDFEYLLNGQLKHNIQEAFNSSTVIECISNTVKDNIENKILDSLNDQTMDMIKAYQNAAIAMFQQISQSFDNGLSKFQTEQESILDAQRSELARLKALLDNKSMLSTRTNKTSIDTACSSSKNTQNSEVAFLKLEQSTLSQPQSDKNDIIEFDSSNVEHGLIEAISRNDIRKITHLFSKTQSILVLKSCEISQKNLLILTKLMTKELESNTLMKLSVIEVCVAKINPLDSETAPHVVRIMSNVKNSIKALPTDHFIHTSESSETLSNILITCSSLQTKAMEAC